jgi:hypothetical protein
MELSVETIRGRKYNFVWYKPEYRKKSLSALDMPTQIGYEIALGSDHIATRLPALPRHPTQEHSGLLFKYASLGIFALLTDRSSWGKFCGVGPEGFYIPNLDFVQLSNAEIIGACDASDKRLKVAIEGNYL